MQDNQDRIREFGTGLGAPALNVVRGAGNAVVATVTVFVLSYLGVLEGPRLVDNTLALLEPTRAERIRQVGRDVWDNRRGRPKQRPTVGADRLPVDARPGAEPEHAPHTGPVAPA